MISPTISANKPMTTRVCTGLSLPVKGVIPCMRSVYQLAISLKDVWRCVLIPDDYPLVQVHEALVTAMGWEGIHLYAFRIENSIYVEDSYDWPEASIDPSTVRFGDFVALGDEFEFHYDFVDGWEHRLTVTDHPPTTGRIRPTCLARQGACPPEDVGGPREDVGGPREYENFLKAMADPQHPRHDEFREWCGGTFDAHAFDARKVDRVFASLDSASV